LATAISLQELEGLLKPIFGLRSWGVRLGMGSFIFLEFGERNPAYQPPETPRGKWSFWIYCCHWQLSRAGIELAHSESDRDSIRTAIQVLDGAKLASISLEHNEGRCHFSFEDEIAFVTTSYQEDAHNKMWMLFYAGKCISVLHPPPALVSEPLDLA
jgi:hypothetical protein